MRKDGREKTDGRRITSTVDIGPVGARGRASPGTRSFAAGGDDATIVIEVSTSAEGSARLLASLARGHNQFVLTELGGAISVRATISERDDRKSARVSQLGEVTIDWENGSIRRRKQRTILSWTERRLLACLVESQGKAISHDELVAAGWPRAQSTISQNLLGVYMRYLRKRLASVGVTGAIRTIRGTGYSFAVRDVVSHQREMLY